MSSAQSSVWFWSSLCSVVTHTMSEQLWQYDTSDSMSMEICIAVKEDENGERYTHDCVPTLLSNLVELRANFMYRADYIDMAWCSQPRDEEEWTAMQHDMMYLIEQHPFVEDYWDAIEWEQSYLKIVCSQYIY